jgi:hypothetical protein
VVSHSQVHFHAKGGHGADVAGECEVDGQMTRTKKDSSKIECRIYGNIV